MAVGAYQALYRAGLRIPQDMAVVAMMICELARYDAAADDYPSAER